MSDSNTIMTVFEGGVYGKVVYAPWPTNPRTMVDCASTLLGLSPRTECYSDKHASQYYLLCEVRRHPRFRPNWENEDHRAYRDFSDIAVLADTARQLGFLVLPMDIDTSGYGGTYLGHFDDSVEDYNALAYVSPQKVREDWGKGPKAYRKARNYLLCEIEEFEQYLNGDVFGVEVGTYHIDYTDPECDDGVIYDEGPGESVWGIVGQSRAAEEMDSMIQYLTNSLSRLCPVLVKTAA